MNGRLPGVSARQLLRALERAGFSVVRSSGSHHYLIHRTDSSRRTVVPYHAARDLPRGLVRAILRQAGLSVDEFRKFL